MKRKFTTAAVLLIVIALFSCVCACSDGNEEKTPPETPDVAVTLSQKTAEIDLYESVTLKATAENTDEAVVWTSSDTSVVTVENGIVTAISVGTATITASAGGATAICAITVYDSQLVPELLLNTYSVTVPRGESFTVTAEVVWKGERVKADLVWQLKADAAENVVEITPADDTMSATVKGLDYASTAFIVSGTYNHREITAKEITVDVKSIGIVFDAGDGLVPDDGAYLATVALREIDGEHSKTVSAPITVYADEGETEIPAAEIIWGSVDDPEVGSISYTDGVITVMAGTKAGTATVTGSFEGNDITLKITAYRPQIELEKVLYIETAFSTLRIPEEMQLNGEKVTAFTFGGVDILDEANTGSTDNTSGNVYLDLSDIVTEESNMDIETEVVISAETVEYVGSGAIVTYAIWNAEDLDGMGDAISHLAYGDNNNIWDGYVILADDIEYNRIYTPFIKAIGDDGKNLGSTANGWAGIFDGKGHVISGMEIVGPRSGFMPLVANQPYSNGLVKRSGIVKNIVFTNAKVSTDGAATGFVSSCNNGTVSNIFVECISQGSNTAVFGWDVANGWSKTEYCIALTTPAENAQNVYGFSEGHYGIEVNNGFVIGDVAAINLGSGNESVNICEQFSSVNEFIEYALNNENFNNNGWNTDVWRTLQGIPVPKKLSASDVSVTSSASRISPGGSFELNIAGRYALISVDDTIAAVSGRTVTVGQDVTGGENITVSVVSMLDSNKTASVTVPVVEGATFNYKTDISYIDEASKDQDSDKFVVDKAALEGDIGDYAKIVSYRTGTTDTKIEDADGTAFMLPLSIFGSTRGNEVTFSFEVEEYLDGDYSVLKAVYIYNVTAYVADLIVSDKSELDLVGEKLEQAGMKKVNPKSEIGSGDTDYYYEGYVALGADIEYNDVWTPFVGPNPENDNKVRTAWGGTFDGRGHIINGLKIEGANSGFMARIAAASEVGVNGLICNVAFTNAEVHTDTGNTGFLTSYMGGQGSGGVRNVYVHCVSQGSNTAIIGWAMYQNSHRILNCIVETRADAGATNVYGFSSNTYYCQLKGIVIGQGVEAYKTQTNSYLDKFTVKCELYGNYSAFIADWPNISDQFTETEWSDVMWNTENYGIPVPKALVTKGVSEGDIAIDEDMATVQAGQSYQIGYRGCLVKLELGSAEGSTDGIELNGNTVTVDGSVSEGTQFKVIVSSVIDAEVTDEITITVSAA